MCVIFSEYYDRDDNDDDDGSNNNDDDDEVVVVPRVKVVFYVVRWRGMSWIVIQTKSSINEHLRSPPLLGTVFE